MMMAVRGTSKLPPTVRYSDFAHGSTVFRRGHTLATTNSAGTQSWVQCGQTPARYSNY